MESVVDDDSQVSTAFSGTQCISDTVAGVVHRKTLICTLVRQVRALHCHQHPLYLQLHVAIQISHYYYSNINQFNIIIVIPDMTAGEYEAVIETPTGQYDETRNDAVVQPPHCSHLSHPIHPTNTMTHAGVDTVDLSRKK